MIDAMLPPTVIHRAGVRTGEQRIEGRGAEGRER